MRLVSDQIIVCSLNDSNTTVSLKKVIAVLASPVSLSYPNSLEKGGWIMLWFIDHGFPTLLNSAAGSEKQIIAQFSPKISQI